jgi:hypothetical protein
MQTVLKLAVLIGAVGFALPAEAATLTNVAVNFADSAFPADGTVMSGTQGYNLFDDATGAKPSGGNGDGDDFSITFINSGLPLLAKQNNLTLERIQTIKKGVVVESGKIVSNRGYGDSKTGRTNNPGTLISTTATLRFSPQWDITNLQAELTSLNTSGVAWEYTVLSFLQPDGTPFSAAPAIGHYADATSLTGSPSRGWYVAASKEATQNVGTDKALTGTGNGPSNDLTLTYALAGLDPNTPIGGLVWTTYLEDTRGSLNSDTNFTASWTGFTVSGVTHADAATPAVPTPALLPGLVSLGLLVRRRRAA